MDESNYDLVRGRMTLERYEDDADGGGGMVQIAPTNEQILTLLDALNADIKGERSPAAEDILRDRWWNS